MVNGKRSFDPVWPGVKTDLKSNYGDLLNITLSVHHSQSGKKENQQLLINGSKYFEGKYNASRPGHIGLSYGRVQNAVFQYYRVQEGNKLNLRSASDYIDYVKAGGNLIVLNTNRNGLLAKSLSLAAVRSSTEASKVIQTSHTNNPLIDRGYYSWLSSFFPRSSRSSNISTIEVHMGQGKITYIDIQPFVQNKTSVPRLYKVLGQVSNLLPLSPDRSSPMNFNEIQGIFREVKGTAKSTVTTTSLIFPSTTEYGTVRLSAPNNKSFSFTNISRLGITGYQQAILSADNNFALTNGIGLYSNLTLSRDNAVSSVDISFDRVAQAALTLPNGKSLDMNVSNLHIDSQLPVHVNVRQPHIELESANATITELYSNPSHTKNLPVAGQDLVVHGSLSISAFMSDTYTLANHFSIDGTVSRIPPLSQYNELASFLPPFSFSKLYSLPQIVRLLILLPFLIAFIFIFYSRGSARSQRLQ
jgi:hypothetical protein